MKKYIISWGGGVNSTGIIAMMKLGLLPEFTKENSYIVFADTGAEMPYTYEHTNRCLSPMARDGWNVKTVCPHRTPDYYTSGFQNNTLIEYCLEKTVMPSRVNRWCTMEYKSKPIRTFRDELEEDTILVLGIGADEKHRAKSRYAADTYYPLIEHDIDREKCLTLAEQAGLPLSKKSGCFMCPYQRKAQWLELYRNHKDLFEQAILLENTAREKYKGKSYFFIRDLPLQEQIDKWIKKEKENCKQEEFSEFELQQNCFCAD